MSKGMDVTHRPVVCGCITLNVDVHRHKNNVQSSVGFLGEFSVTVVASSFLSEKAIVYRSCPVAFLDYGSEIISVIELLRNYNGSQQSMSGG